MTARPNDGSGPAGPFGDDELHAYVDRQLPPARRADVERWLASDPEAAARAAFYGRLNADMHRNFDHVLAEPIPAEWRPLPVWRRRLRDRRTPTVRDFAIAASWLIAGIIGGWSSHDLVIPSKVIERTVEVPVSMPEQAALAYAVFTPEIRHPVEVRAPDEQQHLLTWLSNRMGRPIKAPNLEANGWHLMGGRILPADGGPPDATRVACQFMFEKADGSRLTLYYKNSSAPVAEPSAFRFAQEANGIGVVWWADAKLGYALTGKLPQDELKRLARQVYDQFNS